MLYICVTSGLFIQKINSKLIMYSRTFLDHYFVRILPGEKRWFGAKEDPQEVTEGKSGISE